MKKTFKKMIKPVNLLILYVIAISINVIELVAIVHVIPIWINILLLIMIIPGFVETYNKLDWVK
jgi:hypothetical protein